MTKENPKQSTEKIIEAQNQAGQFTDNFETEFSSEENVQDAIGKSQQYQAKNQQPTFESNKAF